MQAFTMWWKSASSSHPAQPVEESLTRQIDRLPGKFPEITELGRAAG